MSNLKNIPLALGLLTGIFLFFCIEAVFSGYIKATDSDPSERAVTNDSETELDSSSFLQKVESDNAERQPARLRIGTTARSARTSIPSIDQNQLIERLRSSRDPIARAALIRKWFENVSDNDATSAMLTDLAAFVSSITSPHEVYEYCRLLSETGDSSAQNLIVQLALSQGKASDVALSFLLTQDGAWAMAAIRDIVQSENEKLRIRALELALEARTSWAKEILEEAFWGASPEERSYWLSNRLLESYSYQSRNDSIPKQVFDAALGSGDPDAISAAVEYLTDGQHAVHPDGQVWATTQIVEAFNGASASKQVLMLQSLLSSVERRFQSAQNLGPTSIGSIAPMRALLDAGIESTNQQVRDTAQDVVRQIGDLVDSSGYIPEVRRDLEALDTIYRELVR